jgi:glucose 1-dehydrogenase
VLVEALAVGICGTDAEIADGGYGWLPPERDRLILGHLVITESSPRSP